MDRRQSNPDVSRQDSIHVCCDAVEVHKWIGENHSIVQKWRSNNLLVVQRKIVHLSRWRALVHCSFDQRYFYVEYVRGLFSTFFIRGFCSSLVICGLFSTFFIRGLWHLAPRNVPRSWWSGKEQLIKRTRWIMRSFETKQTTKYQRCRSKRSSPRKRVESWLSATLSPMVPAISEFVRWSSW